jgi:hypothetical protein
MLPTVFADAAVYRSINQYLGPARFPPVAVTPPVSSAKWCGQTAVGFGADQSEKQIALCNQQFNHPECVGDSSPNCALYGRLLQSCINQAHSTYADSGVCTSASGTICQDDITSGIGGGYTYCCPPDQKPCAGTCMAASCTRQHEIFDTNSCSCVCEEPYVRNLVGTCACPECPLGLPYLIDDCTCASACPPDRVECELLAPGFATRPFCCQPGEECAEGHCCPAGQIWCTDKCCDPDQCCDGVCCNKLPDCIALGGQCECASGHCCVTGQIWCDDICCYPSQCTDGHCCPSGIWCGGKCCDPAQCCRGICCPTGQVCSEGNCCPTGEAWCTVTGSGITLGECCPPGKCCNGLCCVGDTHCSNDHCCPTGREWSNGGCCPTGQTWTGSHCCPTGQVWCNDRCCDPASCCSNACRNLTNDPSHCGNCSGVCNTAGGQVCQNGHCICTSGRVKCGSICCPPEQVCSGTQCVSPCNSTVFAGGDTPEIHVISLGKTSGTFVFTVDTLSVPDRMIVTYEGGVLIDTGCISTFDEFGGPGLVALQYAGFSTTITVEVLPNCDGQDQPTAWNFTVSCP